MTRPEQLPEYLRSVVGMFLARDIEFPDGMLVSCTRVDVDPHREHATVWISALPNERGAETIACITEHRQELQRAVNKTIRGQAPRLAIRLDKGPAHAARIDALSRDL